MSQLLVPLHEQELIDARGRLQSRAWAELPEALATSYLTGGLKRVRRVVESYFRYRFSSHAAARVHVLWLHGEPTFRLRWLRAGWRSITLLKLGRLRQTGTIDVYRGHMEVLGGALIDPAAIAVPQPWPADLPWVAPSAGEFDIAAESVRPPYLGLFEVRVERRQPGCVLYVATRDVPIARSGTRAWLWNWARRPLARQVNTLFLQQELAHCAAESGHTLRFEVRAHAGAPDPLPPLRRAEVGTAT